LLDVKKDEQMTPGKILAAKQELHQKLNSGVSCACDGCPFLEFKDWGALNTLDIRYLSLEHHSVCNLKCTYCSDEYYGGQQALYDVAGTVDQLIDTGALGQCNLVVWGGGEPTIGKDFDYILGRLREKLPAAQQRILTNSVKASGSVSQLLAEDKAQIVTSIDAGSDDSFAAIRGRKRLQEVLRSLKHYAGVNHDKVTVKYIFTNGNDSLAEVRGFVDHMTASGLLECNFQISGDFKNEHISPESANAMIVMFGLLRKAGARVVYFDELLRHRLGELVNPADAEQIGRIHAEVGLEFIATPARYPEVIVWGAGQQARYLVNQSCFFKSVRLDHFVDATPAKIGTRYLGVQVRDPSSLRESTQPVIIAAVQGYPLILQQYRQLGLPEERVINDLVI
jgi:sulfatase maturation enzyme AslB (radical SAM superfamily)